MNQFIIVICISLLFLGRVQCETSIDFNRDVRPILSDSCYGRHGADEQSREADLRAGIRESATRDLGGYQAIVEGHGEKSELIQRVASMDEDTVIPPSDYGKQLTQDEIAVIRGWINQGAVYQRHWSLQPLVRPNIPNLAREIPPNPVDAFILAKPEAENSDLTTSAQPRTLMRRLAFDLTGLPPAPKALMQFVGNPDDQSYRELVDAMLESPQYGERMASHWLDLVRYAGTLGYHGDQLRSVSPYRDYVIRVFNEANYSLDEMSEFVKLPQVKMIKMGTRNPARWRWDYEQLKAAAPHVTIVTCHDEFLLQTLVDGCDGVLIGFAGFVPELMVEIVYEALDGDLPRAQRAQQTVASLARIVYNFGEPGCDAHQRMKVACWLMGKFPSLHFRQPVRPLSESDVGRIRNELKEIGYDVVR